MLRTFDYEQLPIIEIVNDIMLDCVKRGASDIHFDPHEENMVIRVRIDGTLFDYALVPTMFQRNIVTRIKIISGMNITESRLPQDGTIKTILQEVHLDMQVSTLPTNLGEKIVIHITNYRLNEAKIVDLGFSECNYKKLLKMLSLPNGMILITGATGCGKSTTIYTILQHLNTDDNHIISIEDPIKINIDGINQVQINNEIGLNFSTALQSALHQDANILMIGEIQDADMAKQAIRAAITGHLVLSTIHTNDIVSTIERLLDMDMESYLLSNTLSGIISQKLARKLCNHCKKKRPASLYEQEIFDKFLHKKVEYLYSAEGCEECNNGYKGRLAIQEVLLMNSVIKDAITNKMKQEELKKLLYTQDIPTLLQDGLQKVEEGMTTMEELLKLIDLEKDTHSEGTKSILNGSVLLPPHKGLEPIEVKNNIDEIELNPLKSVIVQEDSEDEALYALQSFHMDFPIHLEEEPEESMDKNNEIENILSEIDFSKTDIALEEELRELLK